MPHWKKAKKGRTVTKSSNLTRKPLFCKDEKKSGIVAPVFLFLAFSGLKGGQGTKKLRAGEIRAIRGMGGGRILRPMEKASLAKRNLPIWNFSTSPLFPWCFFQKGTWQIGSTNYQIFPQDNTNLILLLGCAHRPFSVAARPGMLGTSLRQRRKGHKMLKCKDCPPPPQLTDFSSSPSCNSSFIWRCLQLLRIVGMATPFRKGKKSWSCERNFLVREMSEIPSLLLLHSRST